MRVEISVSRTAILGPLMTYRKDIDGLRAIAVLSVIVFHFFPAQLPGGFLGVDIFFVISGFLITGILYDQRKAGTFTYRGFYERRIRRLFPALIAMLVLCMIAALFLLKGEEMRDFGGSLVTALFGVSNFFFYFEADYFGVSAASRPLLHTWTLSVEEQFYLLWPLLLYVLVKLPVAARVLLVVFLIALSTAIGEYQVRTNADAAFYLLPARVAELAMGGLVAILVREYAVADRLKDKTVLLTFLHGICLAFLVYAFFSYSGDYFPGWLALPPAIATGLLLLAPAKGPLSYLLTNPVSRWVGLISYSAYLIHWPLLVFYKAYSLRSPSVIEDIVLIILTLGLASLFYIFIEQPFRYRQGEVKKISNKMGGIGALASVALLSTFAASAWTGQSWMTSLNVRKNVTMELIMAKRQQAFDERLKLIDVGNCHQFHHETDRDFSHCFKLSQTQFNIFVIGSSFGAGDWLMLKAAYPEANIQRITVQGCLLTKKQPLAKDYCRAPQKAIWENQGKINEFDLVVIAHNWLTGLKPNALTEYLKGIEAPVVLLGPRGKLNVDSYKLIETRGLDGDLNVDDTFLHEEVQIMRQRMRALSLDLGLTYIDMYSLIRDDGMLPLLVSEDELIFHDYGHYTPKGAKYIGRRFRDVFPTPQDMFSGLSGEP